MAKARAVLTPEDLEQLPGVPPWMITKISKHRVVIDHDRCINCGVCADVCPFGVHRILDGLNRIATLESSHCIGPSCATNDFFCVRKCPTEAIRIEADPSCEILGDKRWTPDLLLSVFHEAETEEIPTRLEYAVGESGGGFDKLKFAFPGDRSLISDDAVSTEIQLNRRADGPKITISVPFYGGGMSFGSVSLNTMLARAKAAKAWNTFTCTGEGGYPRELLPFKDHVITQIATGLFGVREETIKWARVVEFKYAQGAKPGLGGHLLSDKNTPDVALMREAVADRSLFSPFPFHSVYSVEDHKKHVDWIKSVNPEALIAVKVSTPTDIDMVAVGSYYAGANVIHLDGGYGGTGAAPEIAKKNIAMPIEYAIPKVHRFLVAEGIRDEVTLVASGGIRTPHDVAKAIALGADGAVLGTAELVAIGCVRCANCERGRGCPLGIATTDPQLSALIESEWGARRIINMYGAWRKEIVHILSRLGLTSVAELRGRTDLLTHVDYGRGRKLDEI